MISVSWLTLRLSETFRTSHLTETKREVAIDDLWGGDVVGVAHDQDQGPSSCFRQMGCGKEHI